MSDLDDLKTKLMGEIADAADEAQIEAVRVNAIGKKGSVSELLKTLGKMDPEERKTRGAAINELKTEVSDAIAARKAALKRYKVTAGGKVLRRKPGKQHINKRKSRKRLRRLGQENPVHFGEVATVAECLPYAKVDVAKAKLQTKSDRAPRPRK